PSVYSDEVHAALQRLDGTVDAELCRSVWLAATSAPRGSIAFASGRRSSDHVLRTLRSLPVDAVRRRSALRSPRSHPSVYSDEVHAALQRLDGTVDAELCRSVWLAATS
ncbi:hypothetical protein CTI14_57105, partial [Methylobacterium radiotolerans]